MVMVWGSTPSCSARKPRIFSNVLSILLVTLLWFLKSGGPGPSFYEMPY